VFGDTRKNVSEVIAHVFFLYIFKQTFMYNLKQITMMKKQLLLLALSAVMWGQSMAADKVPGAIIELSSGKTVEIALTDNPKMTFDGTTVKRTAVNVNVEYTPAEIAKVTIGEVESPVSGISTVETSQATISVEGGFVRLSGFSANEAVKIYTLSGVETSSFETDASGSLAISISSLPQGISIIKASNQIIKITRK
jgi:hypothetical protein